MKLKGKRKTDNRLLPKENYKKRLQQVTYIYKGTTKVVEEYI